MAQQKRRPNPSCISVAVSGGIFAASAGHLVEMRHGRIMAKGVSAEVMTPETSRLSMRSPSGSSPIRGQGDLFASTGPLPEAGCSHAADGLW
jgi:hypothetical protein